MSENQLREAYTLMKQGDKRGAARLVQDVLREDRNNLNAWWLFSHILEDEEKIVKSLEKVLAINPEHPGARKRLAQMRPEYAHLAPAPAPVIKAKAGSAKPSQKSDSIMSKLFLGGIAVVSALITFSVMQMLFNGNSVNLDAVEGPSPKEVAFLQLNAAFSGDYEAMRLYTCDSLEDEWTEIMDDLESQAKQVGMDMSAINFDFSNIQLEESENTGGRIVYDVSGELNMEVVGQSISVDILEATGISEATMILVVNDNRWVVCSL